MRAPSSGPKTLPSRFRAVLILTQLCKQCSPFWEAGFTDVAIVQVGDEGQAEFLDQAAKPLLQKLRRAAG